MSHLNPFLIIPIVYAARLAWIIQRGEFTRRNPDQPWISTQAFGEQRVVVTRAESPWEFWMKVVIDVCIIAVMVFGVVATGGWSPETR